MAAGRAPSEGPLAITQHRHHNSPVPVSTPNLVGTQAAATRSLCNMSTLEKEIFVAERAVLRTALLTKEVQASVQELPKDDSTPVTIADFAAQALLISAIHEAFPEDKFVGEEDSTALREDAALGDRVYELISRAKSYGFDDLASPNSEEDMLRLIDLGGSGQGGREGRFWVMDPVDGTATFLRGEQYAVSLALIEDGKQILGVLACPNLKLDGDGRVQETSIDKEGLGVMLSVIKGRGVSIRYLANGVELPSAQPLGGLQAPPKTENYHIVNTSTSSSTRMDIAQTVAAKLGARYPGTDIWSSHMRYAALAVGGGDFFVRVPAKKTAKSYIWDHAGAQLIFTELGGRITDLDGKEIDFGAGRDLERNHGLVVARGNAYDVVFATVKAVTSGVR